MSRCYDPPGETRRHLIDEKQARGTSSGVLGNTTRRRRHGTSCVPYNTTGLEVRGPVGMRNSVVIKETGDSFPLVRRGEQFLEPVEGKGRVIIKKRK